MGSGHVVLTRLSIDIDPVVKRDSVQATVKRKSVLEEVLIMTVLQQVPSQKPVNA